MRKIILTAMALFMSAGVAMASNGFDNKGYNRVSLGFSAISIDAGDHYHSNGIISTHDWDGEYTGVHFGYIHGFNLTKGLYLETGAKMNFDWDDEEITVAGFGTDKSSYTLGGIQIPVNLGYKFVLRRVYLEPYAGLNAHFNIVAEEEYNGTGYDMFDEKDATLGTFNHVQYGGQTGLVLGFKRHVTLGVEYQWESPLAKFDKYEGDPVKLHQCSCTLSVSYAW